jgi:hypothetical protein
MAFQGGGWWFYRAAIGWGIGVLVHAVSVFFASGKWVKRWEEQNIDQYIRRGGPGPDPSL